MAAIMMNLYEAKSALSRLVDRAAAGEEIIIAKAGRPLARLVGYEGPSVQRTPGGWEGKVTIGEDFDDPLPEEIEAAFSGGE